MTTPQLKRCPFCAEEIQAAAVACKHCGRPLQDARTRGNALALLVIAVIGLSGAAFCAALMIGGGSLTDGIDGAEAAALIERSQAAGMITAFSCTGNHASVSPVFWQSLDAQQKQTVILAFARVCRDQGSGDRITVSDAQSGKRLGAFSSGVLTID